MKIHFLLFLLPLFIFAHIQSEHVRRKCDRIKPEDDFELQLNNIIANFPSRFDSLKGRKDALKDEWDCKLKLAGSDKRVIARFLGHNSFQAYFGLSDKYDQSKSLGQYNSLIKNVRPIKFSCGSFTEVQDDDFVLWKVADPKPGFENLGIQISFVMMVGYHDDKQYAVELKVYDTSD